jgi:hypothetical protein
MDKVKAHRRIEPVPIRERNPQVPETFAHLIHHLMAKSPADRFGSASQVEAILGSWRSGNEKPLDTPGDQAFQQAVRTLIDGWKVPEPTAIEISEDVILFQAEPDERSATAEVLSQKIFAEIDRIDPRVWMIGVVALLVAIILFCGLGTCVLSLMQT